jgi:hypothetical protein
MRRLETLASEVEQIMYRGISLYQDRLDPSPERYRKPFPLEIRVHPCREWGSIVLLLSTDCGCSPTFIQDIFATSLLSRTCAAGFDPFTIESKHSIQLSHLACPQHGFNSWISVPRGTRAKTF